MHDDLEAAAKLAAEEASRQAFVDTLRKGYEKKIENLKAQREVDLQEAGKQIQALKEQHEQALADAAKNPQELKAQHEQELERYRRDHVAYIDDLSKQHKNMLAQKAEEVKQRIEKLEADKAEDSRQWTQLYISYRTRFETAEAKVKDHDNEVARVKLDYEKQLDKMRKKLQVGPNSWFEITLHKPHNQLKTFVRRPNSKLYELEELLRKVVNKKSNQVMSFQVEVEGKVQGNLWKTKTDKGKTLQALGIRDGTVLAWDWFGPNVSTPALSMTNGT